MRKSKIVGSLGEHYKTTLCVTLNEDGKNFPIFLLFE